MSKINYNNQKVLPLKFNPITGKYTLPTSYLDKIVIRMPNGMVNTDLKLVLVQSSKTNTVSLGVTNSEIKGLESAKDLPKIQAATRILQNAFDEKVSKNVKDEMIDLLSSFKVKEVEESLTEHSRINLVKLIRCFDNLNANIELFDKNISKDDLSKEYKSALLKVGNVLKAHLSKEFLTYVRKQNFKLNEIKGIPSSLANLLVNSKIQLSKTESLSKIFYSSTKPGLVLTLSELTDNTILKLFQPLSGLNYVFACYVKHLLKQAGDSIREELLKEKVNMIPPVQLTGKVRVPTYRTFRSMSPQGGIINNLTRLFRLETGDNFINENLSMKYFGLEQAKPGDKPARARLLEKLKDLVLNGKLDQNNLISFIEDRLKICFKDYGVKEFKVDKNGAYVVPVIKLGEMISPDDLNLLEGEEKKKNHKALLDSEIVASLLRKRSKRKRRNQLGFVRSKNAISFLKVIKKSKIFGDLADTLEEFLYSFQSKLLQARAADILYAELLRIKEKAKDPKYGYEIDDDDHDDDQESDQEGLYGDLI